MPKRRGSSHVEAAMPRSPLDEELATVTKRRTDCVDLLVRCLIEIDTLTNRITVLLDRKLGAETPLETTQEMPPIA
jgi:hypothetical protein